MRSDKWPSLPLRRLGTIVGGGTPTSEDENWNDGIPFVTPPDLRPVVGGVVGLTERFLSIAGASSGSSLVPPGSVLLSIRAPIGYVARTDRTVAFNQGCRALVPKAGVSARYLVYALVASNADLEALGRGTTFTEVSGGQMASFEVSVPPAGEQRAIADFLDRETAQIDTLIAKQEQLIATLRERRVSLIDRGVFGLDLEASDRIVPLIGHHLAVERLLAAIPATWQVLRFKVVLHRLDTQNADLSQPMMSLRSTGEIVDRATLGERQEPADSSLPRYLVVRANDLVVNPMWLVGGGIGVSGVDGAVSPDYRVFRSAGQHHPRYLHHLLRSRPYIDQYLLYTRAQTTFDRRVQQRDLNNLPLPVPPLRQQQEIADQLDARTAQIDTLISTTERFIELSKERRSALITAAVTGQIDVRGAA